MNKILVTLAALGLLGLGLLHVSPGHLALPAVVAMEPEPMGGSDGDHPVKG